jgi:predicted dehydrogenase
MGMVGGGRGAFIGAVHRIAATMDNQVEVAAGCFSRDFENTNATGRDLYLDPMRCYPTYEQMAAAEAKLPSHRRIDFVSVVTPNVSHFDICRTFLKAGIHVVCDKPMTCTLAEARKLVKLVERSGLVFGVTHNYTGYPVIKHARELFRDGSMGTVQKVLVEYLQDFFAVSPAGEVQGLNAWRFDPATAGRAGTLGDIGTHCFNLVEYVTGDRVTGVSADMHVFAPGRKLDDDSNVMIRLGSGGAGSLVVSQCAIGEENGFRLRVFASRGSILWEQENPNYLRVYRYGEPLHTLTRANDKYMSQVSRACCRLPKGHPEGFVGAFANVYCDVVRAVRRHVDGKPMKTEEYRFPTVYDGLRGMQFIAASLKSARSGSKWVRV